MTPELLEVFEACLALLIEYFGEPTEKHTALYPPDCNWFFSHGVERNHRIWLWGFTTHNRGDFTYTPKVDLDLRRSGLSEVDLQITSMQEFRSLEGELRQELTRIQILRAE